MEIKTNGFKLPSGDIHVFIPPEPTETDRGGIKASEKTTESLEVKYDKKTGKLFSPTSPTDNTLTKSNVAADAKKTGDEFARVNNNMESKLDKQQGAENAGKAMVINPEGVIVPGEVQGGDGIPIINTMSGESPLVIPDSAERVNKGFSMSGNTEQASTNGLNLFNYKDFVDINTYGDDTSGVYRRKYLQLKPNTSYRMTIFKNRMAPSMDVTVMFIGTKETCDNTDANGLIVFFTSTDKKSTTITTKESGQIVLKLNKNSTPELQEEYLSQADIILSEGDTEIPYEPYTGGKPSPSPEYPQEIKNVGKWNEEKQKYEVDVRVTGKNLIGKYNILDSKGIDASGNVIDKPNACISDLIMVQKDQQHTLSLNNVDGITIVADLYDSNKKFIGYHFATASNAREFILKDDCFIRFIFSKPKTYILSTNIQLETKKGASSYEPQREPQTLTLTSDRPITKWDKLVEQDGQIGWLYKTEEITLNGDESWELYTDKKHTFCFSPSYLIQDGFCTHYDKIDSIYFDEKSGVYLNNTVFLLISEPNAGDIEEFKAILSEKAQSVKPIKVVCYSTKLNKFVPLPQSEQEAIRALKTYYPTTVITTDGGELDPSVELTYTADTKNFILNREKVMQAQILNMQNALISQKISGGYKSN